jgi:hypothetical protein
MPGSPWCLSTAGRGIADPAAAGSPRTPGTGADPAAAGSPRTPGAGVCTRTWATCWERKSTKQPSWKY